MRRRGIGIERPVRWRKVAIAWITCAIGASTSIFRSNELETPAPRNRADPDPEAVFVDQVVDTTPSLVRAASRPLEPLAILRSATGPRIDQEPSHPSAIRRLVALLRDESPECAAPEVRRAAIHELLRVGPDAAASSLELLLDPHTGVNRAHRRRILDSVRELAEELDDPRVLPALLRVRHVLSIPLEFDVLPVRSLRLRGSSLPPIDRKRWMADLRHNLEATPPDSRCFDHSLRLFAWISDATERDYVRTRWSDIVNPRTRHVIDGWFAAK
jgi:hypothetical protein